MFAVRQISNFADTEKDPRYPNFVDSYTQNMRNGRIETVDRKSSFPSDEGFLESDNFMRPPSFPVARDIEFRTAEFSDALPEMQPVACISRPRLTNKSMLKGLVERTDHYNKTVDQKVMTDSRIAFEDEQLKGRGAQDLLTRELEQLATSNQHIPTRGRGDSFGKLRSSDGRDTPTKAPMLNNHGVKTSLPLNPAHTASHHARFQSTPGCNVAGRSDELGNTSRVVFSGTESDSLNFQSPRRSVHSLSSRLARMSADDVDPPTRHHFDPATAYSGTVVPNYRYNYQPQSNGPPKLVTAVETLPPPPFGGHRYPKRPENSHPTSSQPKHLNHNYYDINLYGATQEERIAQRIEKTVRRTEAPPRF